MVCSCSANGCSNRQVSGSQLSFYRFPKDPERRAKWVTAVKRENWTPSATSRLCSAHFIGGKKSDNPRSPNYSPTIFSHVKSPERRKRERELKEFQRRQGTKMFEEGRRSAAANALLDLSQNDTLNDEENDESHNEDQGTSPAGDRDIGDKDQRIECQHLREETQSLQLECQLLREENKALKNKVAELSLEENGFVDNDAKVKDLTGIPTFVLFMATLGQLSSYMQDKAVTLLSAFQQMLVVCMRLKCNLDMQILAYMFGVSKSTVSSVFNDTLTVMDRHLVPSLVFWPEREQLELTMPASLRKPFTQCACFIDCLEILIGRASDLKTRPTQTSYSTIKYLIGITPKGTISFVSKGWGGRASDKLITNNCGFVDKLLPGDLIIADRSFDVGDSVDLYNTKLQIAAFTKGEQQLCPLDVETTRALASKRIHIERVIGLTRQKYTMLESTIPTTYLQRDQYELTTLDKVVRVACALTNLSEPVVPFD